ncbi:MAG TPA: wax ester/triacylglycerol synthase domain-containing protein, partial [Propionibacteriaceae bacterium]|nr:wax ester/triacylglycerol synthase domain-containing protein [Propionibacteriaceae bacterium]
VAMDTGRVPQQFAVILVLDKSDDLNLSQLQKLISNRIRAVPRLWQRLIKVPPGCGRSVWVDDADFNVDRHVRAVACRAPGDEPALYDTALSVIMDPLPKDAPLWLIILINDLADGTAAVVVVLHHVLADGLGGVNVLAALLDPGAPPAAVSFPREAPTRASLARDAWRTRLLGIRRAAGLWPSLRRSMFAGGGFRPARATPCSLVQQTGPHLRMTVVRLDRGLLRAAAHRNGATTNDAVLVAVAGALHQLLLSRGESIDPIAITVPVSGRRPGGGPAIGNLVSPMLVDVPARGNLVERLAQVESAVRAHKAAATGPAPIAILGGVFRFLARLGGYRFYMKHQHRFHTLVTHVRGPAEPVTLGGHQVSAAIPIGVGDRGNMTVYFEVLSYAGVLTIAVIVDPDHGPDLGALTHLLQSELDSIMASP